MQISYFMLEYMTTNAKKFQAKKLVDQKEAAIFGIKYCGLDSRLQAIFQSLYHSGPNKSLGNKFLVSHLQWNWCLPIQGRRAFVFLTLRTHFCNILKYAMNLHLKIILLYLRR